MPARGLSPTRPGGHHQPACRASSSRVRPSTVRSRARGGVWACGTRVRWGTARPRRGGAGGTGRRARSRRRRPRGGRDPCRCTDVARRRTRGGVAASAGAGRSGRGRRRSSGSRFAPASDTVTGDRLGISVPASSTSRVAYRSIMDAAGSSRSDSSTAAGIRVGSSRTTASCSGSRRRCQTALRSMPSVVSIPPNMITAAFDTTSAACSDPARSEVDNSELDSPPTNWRRNAASSSDIACAPARVIGASRRHHAHRVDDLAIPAEELVDLLVAAVEPEAVGNRRGGQRAGELRAQLGAAATGDDVEATLDLVVHEIGEALRHPTGLKRCGERIAMPRVLDAVDRQHARTDDAGGRKARIVHRERRGVTQYADRRRPPRHQECAERRYPRRPVRVPATVRGAGADRRSGHRSSASCPRGRPGSRQTSLSRRKAS